VNEEPRTRNQKPDIRSQRTEVKGFKSLRCYRFGGGDGTCLNVTMWHQGARPYKTLKSHKICVKKRRIFFGLQHRSHQKLTRIPQMRRFPDSKIQNVSILLDSICTRLSKILGPTILNSASWRFKL